MARGKYLSLEEARKQKGLNTRGTWSHGVLRAWAHSRRSSANVRFSADYVCFAPRCGRGKHPRRTSQFDPQRSFVLPEKLKHLSLTSLQEKLVKIGAKVARHGRYITFQMAEVAISRPLFAEILRLIDRLRPAPLPP